MDPETSKRLDALESHLAHLEHQFDKLNEVVTEHTRLLRRMQTQQQRIAQSVESMEIDRIKSDRSKPPHYQ
jgi:uncharacterized coiled-coil protein SlyX